MSLFEDVELEPWFDSDPLEELYAGYWNGQKLEDLSFSHLRNILQMMRRDDWPEDAIEIIEAEIKDRELSGAAARELFGLERR